MTTEQPSKKYDTRQELKYCSILLRRAAVSAMNIIREFLSLITSIPHENTNPSVDSSPPATAGPQKSSAPKSGSAEYYVRTATGSTHSFNKTTTPTPQSSPPCEKLIKQMDVGPENCEKIREGIISGKIDLRTVSMATWLQVSYLALFNKQVTNGEQAIVHNGNVYNLHFCVSGVVPPASPEKLQEKQ